MARYIRVFLDADNLRVELAKLCERFNISFGEESKGFGKALSELPETLPAADVRSERHGKWVHLGGDEWGCSCCGFVISTESSWEHPISETQCNDFCRKCGAKMDGKDV